MLNKIKRKKKIKRSNLKCYKDRIEKKTIFEILSPRREQLVFILQTFIIIKY